MFARLTTLLFVLASVSGHPPHGHWGPHDHGGWGDDWDDWGHHHDHDHDSQW